MERVIMELLVDGEESYSCEGNLNKETGEFFLDGESLSELMSMSIGKYEKLGDVHNLIVGQVSEAYPNKDYRIITDVKKN